SERAQHRSTPAPQAAAPPRVAEHRRVAESRARPALRDVVHVKVALDAAAPVERDRALDALRLRVFADRLDRREARAARHHHDRLVALLAQIKRAERAFEAQEIAYLHRAEHLLGDQATRRLADVELQRADALLARRIGDRVAAALGVVPQEV